MKKIYIVLGLFIALFIGWRIYQNGVPGRMMNTIQTLEHKEDIIRLFGYVNPKLCL